MPGTNKGVVSVECCYCCSVAALVTFLPYSHPSTLDCCSLRDFSTLHNWVLYSSYEKLTKDPQPNGSTHDQRSVHKVRTSSFDRRISRISTNYPAQMSASEAREGGRAAAGAPGRGRAPCVMQYKSGGSGAGERQSAFATGVGKTRPADR